MYIVPHWRWDFISLIDPSTLVWLYLLLVHPPLVSWRHPRCCISNGSLNKFISCSNMQNERAAAEPFSFITADAESLFPRSFVETASPKMCCTPLSNAWQSAWRHLTFCPVFGSKENMKRQTARVHLEKNITVSVRMARGRRQRAGRGFTVAFSSTRIKHVTVRQTKKQETGWSPLKLNTTGCGSGGRSGRLLMGGRAVFAIAVSKCPRARHRTPN